MSDLRAEVEVRRANWALAEDQALRDIQTIAALHAEVERLRADCDEADAAAAATVTGPRFHTDGDIVTDSETGLQWSRKPLKGKHTWSAAKVVANACELGGHRDWRLPTIRELLSIVDYANYSPALDTSVLECPAAAGWYWTATPAASAPSVYAWCVYGISGYSGWVRQDGEGLVRAVRSARERGK